MNKWERYFPYTIKSYIRICPECKGKVYWCAPKIPCGYNFCPYCKTELYRPEIEECIEFSEEQA